MNTEHEIAAEVSQYLQSQPLAQADFAAQHGPELEASHRDVAQQQPDLEPHARGLGETASGITGWVWHQVEPVVKQQICSPENYETLSSITTAQLAARIDDILTPFAATVTDALPVALKLLTPLLPLLRKLIANIIAQELEQAGAAGWAAYCGLPASQSSAVAAVAG
ncbi:MAG: hypothetical protein U0350_28840 [Caldilineaceae bacterium]